jgi:hypothetical protein
MAKIDKAYIIRIDRPDSIEYAKQCADSCEKHGVPYEYFEGAYQWDRAEVTRRTGWIIREESHPDWHNEFLCTISHMLLYRKMIEEYKTIAILEHDAIVTGNFMNLDVYDGIITNLGYRVDTPDDVIFPEGDVKFKQYEIDVFEGTHAYALTPETARLCLERIGQTIIMPIDGLIAIRNIVKMKRSIVMPTPAVGWVRQEAKSSTMKDEKVARYHPIPPKEYWNYIRDKSKYQVKDVYPGYTRVAF